MKNLKLSILVLLLTSTAYAQPWGGAFNPEGPSSAYQIFTNKNKFVGLLGASDITVQQSLETLSYISASPTTINSKWNYGNGGIILPQAATLPTPCSEGQIGYDSDATSGQRIYACESGAWMLEGDAGIGGSGDNIIVNGTAAVDLSMNESAPAIPASGLGVKWQTTGSNPTKLSAYAAVSTSSVLSGALSDETGSGSAVFATSPTITSPTISTSIALPSDAVDAITEIASTLKTGTAAKLATGTAGTNGNCAQWNANGDVVDSGAACGGGSGDSIFVNGSAVVDANLNESNPSTPASGLSVKWQTTGSSPAQVTGYAAVNTSAVLAGVVNDETGSSGGVLVFSSTPTIVSPSINRLSNLTTNGFIKTSSGNGTLTTDTNTYQTLLNNSAGLAGALSDETGTGLSVFATSPVLTTPNIGVATATSVNKVAITAPATSATLTIADGKTLTVNNTATIGTLTDTKFCTYTAAGTSIDCTSSGGVGGDSILINGTAVTDANFNESNPSTPASGLSIKWQRTGSNPDQVTGYAAVSTSAILAGAISDETGSSGGVAVFSSAPTIQNATLSNYVIIPNSANPTVTTAGSVSVDTSTTTGSTLRFYGDAQYSLHGYKSKSFVITGTTASSDAGVWKVPFAITIKAVHVLVTGGTNVIGQLANCDANGANCSAIDADITATAGTNANDDGTLSSPSIAALNYVGWLTTSVSGTNTRTVVTFEYTEDAVN